MIHIAIVEDEIEYQRTILSYMHAYEQENSIEFNISVFSDGADILRQYNAQYDIILMDIEMNTMDGMTAARKIRETDSAVILIFITNMVQYALQGYEVSALDYILKPIEYFPFSQRLAKTISRIPDKQANYLIISGKKTSQKVNIRSILWVESRGHRLMYHTDGGVFESTVHSMKEIEKKLAPFNFFRCNNGFLVNLECVTGVSGNEVTVGTDHILISQSRRAGLMRALTEYAQRFS